VEVAPGKGATLTGKDALAGFFVLAGTTLPAVRGVWLLALVDPDAGRRAEYRPGGVCAREIFIRYGHHSRNNVVALAVKITGSFAGDPAAFAVRYQ
jgi:hypothetical protein